MNILSKVIKIEPATKGQREDEGSIALDFDGVIHKYSKGWYDGTIYDKPMDGVEEALTFLLDKGYHLFIFTARPNLNDIPKWLKENFTDKRIHRLKVTNKKLPANIYIDDRGYRFVDWKTSIQFIRLMRNI